MTKQGIRSYWSSLHPKNIKKLKEAGRLGWAIYWMIFYPFLMSLINPEMGPVLGIIMWRALPIFIIVWTTMGSKFLMTKAMFLSPMKYEDRKSYISTVIIMGIGFPLLLSLLQEMLSTAIRGFEPLIFSGMLLSQFTAGVCIYICYIGRGANDKLINMARTNRDGETKTAWMNILGLVVSILVMATLVAIDVKGAPPAIGYILIGIGMLVMMIVDILIIMLQWKDTIRQAGNYELTFQVLSQVPTNDNVEFDLFKKR